MIASEGLTGQRLVLAAAASAAAVSADLMQVAYEGDLSPCRSLDDDTVPQLADALKMTLEFTQADTTRPSYWSAEDRDAVGQLLGAVVRFLEHWA